MKGHKTPSTAYVEHIIKTTGRPELVAILDSSPLTDKQKTILILHASGMSYAQIAKQFSITAQAINYDKRKACERLHYFLTQKLS